MEQSSQKRTAGERTAANAARMFFALWYLIGCFVHMHFAFTNTQVYEAFGRTALFPSFSEIWVTIVMPHIFFFALLLAAFEMTTGLFILSKRSYVRVGLAASVSFNLFLAQLGLARVTSTWGADLLANRLPDLLMALLQVPLFWICFEKTVPELLRDRLHQLIPGRRSGATVSLNR